jgi:uncharacterized protein YecT (DUF1311 family)
MTRVSRKLNHKHPMKYFLTLIQVVNAYAQTEVEEHIIDKQWRECLDSTENQTTVGMTACSIQAAKVWDKELNKNYRLLMSKLSGDEKEELKNAQRNWILYRDKEMEFASIMYINLEGTMWRIVLADRETEMTRQRALELKVYYDNLP